MSNAIASNRKLLIPMVAPIVCATVICVPCVYTFIAGIDIAIASTNVRNIHISAAIRKR